jgi:predicted nucleotidyltransferase
MYLFGSATDSKTFSDTSDIDLIVQFEELDLPPEDKGQLYWDLLAELENLFGRKVDLLKDKQFNNPYFRQQVESQKVLIYDRSKSKEVLV